MEKKFEKLLELMSDAETAKALGNLSVEDAQAELAKKGLDFSVEELKAFAKGVMESDDEGAELSEDALSNVAGGSYEGDCYYYGKRAGKVLRQIFTIAAPFAAGLW